MSDLQTAAPDDGADDAPAQGTSDPSISFPISGPRSALAAKRAQLQNAPRVQSGGLISESTLKQLEEIQRNRTAELAAFPQGETHVPSATDESVTAPTAVAPSEVDEVEEDDSVALDSEITGEDDGRISAKRVSKIVRKRIEKAERRIREEMDEEVQAWQQKAAQNRVQPDFLTQQPKPEMANYSANPAQFEKDLQVWSTAEANRVAYHQNVISAYAAKARAFAATTAPDFEERVNRFFGSLSVHPAFLQQIYESDVGPQMAYFLTKNLKEFNRINGYPNVATMVKEIGKLELQLTGVAATLQAPPAATVPPVVQHKPTLKPTTVVRGGTPAKTVTTKAVSTLADRKRHFLPAGVRQRLQQR